MPGFPIAGHFRELTEVELLILNQPANTKAWIVFSKDQATAQDSSATLVSESISETSGESFEESLIENSSTPRSENLNQTQESVILLSERRVTPPVIPATVPYSGGPRRRGRVSIEYGPLPEGSRDRSRSPLQRTPISPAYSELIPTAAAFSPSGELTETPKTAGRLIPRRLQFS